MRASPRRSPASSSRRRLSRDAVPDLSDPQIGLVADWMGHPATEVATRVSQVLTDALGSVPGSTAIRGSSMSGMAYVDVLFGSSADLERPRQEIVQRVARMPRQAAGERSSSGRAGRLEHRLDLQYALVNPHISGASVALRQLQDNLFRPALEAIPGVAEVAAVGEPVQELLVVAEPEQLRAREASPSATSCPRWFRVAHGEARGFTSSRLALRDDARGGSRRRGSATSPVSRSTRTCRSASPTSAVPRRPSAAIVVARRGADPRAVIESVERTLDRAATTAAQRRARDGLRPARPREPRRAHAAPRARRGGRPWSRWSSWPSCFTAGARWCR